MTKALANRVALVTGATRGIGRAIANRLASDGARIICTATRPSKSLPADWTLLISDFSDPAQVGDLARQVADLGVDILINNAGINKIAPFCDIDPGDFARIQRVNVEAPLRLMQAVIPGMRVRGWGRIVNISSIWGRISKEQRASYSASKFALDGMGAALAAEVASDGILVNAIAPGFVDTELTRVTLGEDGVANMVAQVPIRRLGQPEEIAAFVAWLAGPENTYISGQNIAIDGGFTRV